jgi:EAL domain-containing protein (putative c-di-GMP-specific phosphodiesterase class I)
VETITKLCRSLGICTVAEAVETAEQVEVLREVGVEIGQGYFFSAPMTAAAAADLAAMVPHPRFALAVPAMH